VAAAVIQPILQFGTSRFLQAHVDLFVSEALARGAAIGGITVVQTTADPVRARRVQALALGGGYPVRLRGLQDGTVVDRTVRVDSVRAALHADTDWAQVRAAVLGGVRVIVSNTADSGWQLDAADGPALLDDVARVPRSLPAKLVVLLHARWRHQPAEPLSLFPCELVERNGDTLRDLVVALAARWGLPAACLDYLGTHCRWANTLVDRIVSEAIEPAGAVAEPYALWAIEQQAGLLLPCAHEAIVLTADLQRYERLKLFLLNLGHTWLAEQWLATPFDDRTVVQAMNDPAQRAALEAVWSEEVLPVFEALGQRRDAEAYLVTLRERLCNPFLAHRLADIAQNHAQKKQRRMAPVVALAATLGLPLAQPRLRGALASA
jgi:tagaturonate reductase